MGGGSRRPAGRPPSTTTTTTSLRAEPTSATTVVFEASASPLPVLSTAFCAACFAWLRVKVAAYNSAADDLVAARAALREAKVAQLAGAADAATKVAASEARADDARTRMEDARRVGLGPNLVARVRVPDRADLLPDDLGAPRPATKDDQDASTTTPAAGVRVALLAATVAVLVPVFLALALADPMRPPSPALDAAFTAMDGAPPPVARGLDDLK